MTHSRPQRYALVAQELRDSGAFEDAGTYYTAAAHGWFMRFQSLPEDLPESYSIPAHSPKNLGRGVQDMLAAALCFRLADSLERGQNRCEQGLLFVEELLDHDDFGREKDGAGTPRLGLLHEMVGDLRLFGNLGRHDDAYAVAAEYYSEASSERGWQSEPEFDSLIRTLVELANSTNYGLDKQTEEQILHQSLTARIEYKHEHYPSILEEVLADGTWHSDSI